MLSLTWILPCKGNSIPVESSSAGNRETEINWEKEESIPGVLATCNMPAGSIFENTIDVLSDEKLIRTGLLFADEHEIKQAVPINIRDTLTKHLIIL